MHLLEGTDNIQDTTMTMLNNGSVEASNASIPIPNSSQSKCDKMSFGQALRHRVIKVVPPPKKQHPQPSVSQAEEGKLKFPTPEDPSDNLAFYILFSTYLSFGMMVFVSFCRELLATLFYQGAEETKDLRVQNGLAPLMTGYDSFFTRRLYRRIRDCWNRPTTGVAGKYIHVKVRQSSDYNASFENTGEIRKCYNLSSYNYLGFSEEHGPCTEKVKRTILKYGLTAGGSYMEMGRHILQDELEALVAQFVGMEASLVCNMGYATNLMHIPAIMSGKGTLILSDQLNHTSLVFGCRLAAGAAVKVFRHCDLIHLEQLLKEMISQGQPKNHKPWRRIIVLIEGLYSMEGTLPYLPGLLALKRKYKFYLWIDEAHSIGAIGPRGRGICDWFHLTNTEKSQIDLLMGTFTKSFGAAGGYIAGSKALISFLRQMGHSVYAPEITSPPILEMILESMKVMMNIHPTIHDGSLRLTKIHENAIYFRSALRSLGFIVTGEESSPVIPMLIFQPSKMAIFSRECLAHGIAVVIVAYPATAMNLARVRFCMSSNHDLKDLEKIVQVISDIGDKLNMKFHKHLKVSELIKS